MRFAKQSLGALLKSNQLQIFSKQGGSPARQIVFQFPGKEFFGKTIAHAVIIECLLLVLLPLVVAFYYLVSALFSKFFLSSDVMPMYQNADLQYIPINIFYFKKYMSKFHDLMSLQPFISFVSVLWYFSKIQFFSISRY